MNEPLSGYVKELIDRYLAGSLDEAQMEELEQHLLRDVELRRYFVRFARLNTDLHLEAHARLTSRRALDQINHLQKSEPLSTSPPTGNPTAGMPRKGSRRFSLSRGFAIAAGLLLTAGLGCWFLFGRPASFVAGLVNAQDCSWVGEERPEENMKAGKILNLQRGLAEIRFECGASVLLQGPARVELLSGRSARLLSGRLTARVPPAAVGFEVLWPQGKIIDHGTEFGMAVSEGGGTEVFVFEGKVEARPARASNPQDRAILLVQNQAVRIDDGKVNLIQPNPQGDRFVRAIVPPPVIVPRTLRLTFDGNADSSIADAEGLRTGLTHRLPGTGDRLPEHDPNLRLDPAHGRLELTTTRSDIRGPFQLDRGEYLGVKLTELGFTGKEDFAVTATVPNTPELENFGQFGLYAGTGSDRNIRGGLIKWGRRDPGQNTQFLVNSNSGRDTDLYRVGLLSPGKDLRFTLRRTAGKYSLTVDDLTDGGASTLTIRHPELLDGERDLYVGLFGANPYTDVQKTLTVKEFSVTVWAVAPGANHPD